MSDEAHHRALERTYASANCNERLRPKMVVGEGSAEIRFAVDETTHHAAHAVHGAYYFKALDDACFFAANSLVPDHFVLTASFSLEFLRPVTGGELVATGRVVKPGKNLVFAEATLVNENGTELARGRGTFARSKIPLDERVGYVR
jgi:uncharacterized protein (TIGR00369 family)